MEEMPTNAAVPGDFGDSFDFTELEPLNLWDDGDKQETAGETVELDEEEFDYELELKRQEQALMEKYGVHVGSGEYSGDPLTSLVIGLGLSNIGRPVDTTLLFYLTFEASSKNLCDVNELQSYTNLTTVILADNRLRSLEPLRKMKNLKVLNAHGNLIESLDATPLHKFKWLQALNLGRNKLETLEGFQPNTLVYLHLAYNALDSVGVFTSDIFPNLLSLELRGNQLRSLKGLDLPKLRQIFLAENFLYELSGINGCPSLETLHVRQNQIKGLTIWPSLEKLQYLNLRANRIRRFTQTIHLENCPNLRTLILTGNPITQSEHYKEEVLAACTSLKRLDRILLSELEIVEARLRRTKRQNGTLPPVHDDPAIAPFESEDEGESNESAEWIAPGKETEEEYESFQ